MEAHLQCACVAQLEEPVFCDSSLASLIKHYNFGPISDIALEDANDSEPRASQSQEQNENQAAVETDIGAVSRLRDLIAAHPVPSYDARNPYHPRPQSQDIAQEEDGRRTRFALQDPDEYAEIIRRILHLNSNPDDATSQVQDAPTSAPSEAEHALPALSSTLGIPSFYAQRTEDEALAPDDPRLSYDFKDFMHGMFQDPTAPDLDISPLLPTSPNIVTRSSLKDDEVDIQGLRWRNFELSRAQVVGSRTIQHPSIRTNISLRPSSVEDMLFTAETQYRFRSFSQQHRAQYRHYQLRHVLAATNRAAIFYATGNKVVQTALACPEDERTIIDLSKNAPSPSPVRITCLSAGTAPRFRFYRTDDVLLAGGFGGEYAMLDLNAPQDTALHTGFVTHDYNGLVTHIDSYTHRRSGQLQASFCTNDRKIRLLDIKTNHFTNTFSYEHAINCSAMAPDKRLRVLVGDSDDTLITDAENGNILVTLKEHNDHGFACAWAEDGVHVATGAQDRRVVLWDARNWKLPLRVITCGIATARSLHFTDDGALVVGEDDDVVSIYHTKKESVRQEIRFFGSVAGVALLDGGDEMVIANADRSVGGLLTFQRNFDGRYGGSSGEQILDRREAAWLRHAPVRRRCGFVSGLVV